MIAGLFPFIHIPGVDFDVFIRGWLVVAVGVLVLMGSVYMLLATNTGARTGLMIALTGLFAWMTIMAVIWWIYGIGLKGPGAHWTVREVNRGDLATAEFPKAQELGAALDAKFGGEASPEAIQAFFQQEEIAVGEQGAAVPLVGDWHAMLLTNPARGEAQATVDAFLVGPQGVRVQHGLRRHRRLRDRRQDPSAGERGVSHQEPHPGGDHGHLLGAGGVEAAQDVRAAQASAALRRDHGPAGRPADAGEPARSGAADQGARSEPADGDDHPRPGPGLGAPAVRHDPLGSATIFTALALSLHRRDKRQEANRAGALAPTAAGGS